MACERGIAADGSSAASPGGDDAVVEIATLLSGAILEHLADGRPRLAAVHAAALAELLVDGPVRRR